ncbi:MAG: hypothetical protein ACLR2O_17330 [Coprococcus sp.]
MKNWLKKCSVALLVFSMIGTTMPVYAAEAPAAKTQTTTEDQTEEQKSGSTGRRITGRRTTAAGTNFRKNVITG